MGFEDASVLARGYIPDLGGNRLAWRLCRRRLELFPCFWKGGGQAQGLVLPVGL